MWRFKIRSKELVDFIRFYNQDPCETGSKCVVRAGCSIKQQKPWWRSQKCPEYKTFINRKKRVKNIIGVIRDTSWIAVILSWVLMIIVTFFLGLWKWGEIIKGIFE